MVGDTTRDQLQGLRTRVEEIARNLRAGFAAESSEEASAAFQAAADGIGQLAVEIESLRETAEGIAQAAWEGVIDGIRTGAS